MSAPRPPSAPAYDTLQLQRQDAVDWLTLNRPGHLNSLSSTMCDELRDYFERLQRDHAVRVVLLRGAGRAFCAGLDHDNPALAAQGPERDLRAQRQMSDIILRMRRCPQPIIALIHGAAHGPGLALALAADVRIAADNAHMEAASLRLGLSGCGLGISYFLPRLVGLSVASELILAGRRLDARRALRCGLVSELVPEEQLGTAGQSLAADMLAASPLGLRLTKDGLNVSVDAPGLEAAIAMEDRQQSLCAGSDDFREGAAASGQEHAPQRRER